MKLNQAQAVIKMKQAGVLVFGDRPECPTQQMEADCPLWQIDWLVVATPFADKQLAAVIRRSRI